MKYALNNKNKLVWAETENKSTVHRCSYCLKIVNLRKGDKNSHNFAHRKGDNEDEACPYYHSSISCAAQTIKNMQYINGGAPLYLAQIGEKSFELHLYMPLLSDELYGKLCLLDARVRIESSIYRIRSGYKAHRITTINQNITPSCDAQIQERNLASEFRHKWLCNIRAINIQRDIFHVAEEGGYRVALNSDVLIGKRYRIIVDEVCAINGIEFEHQGYISLKDTYSAAPRRYNVLSFVVNNQTEQALAFVQSKMYGLKEKCDDLTHIWPPACFNGRDLVYEDGEAYFYYNDITNKIQRNKIGVDDIDDNNAKERVLIMPTNGYNALVRYSTYISSAIERNTHVIKYSLFKVKSYNYTIRSSPSFDLVDLYGSKYSFCETCITPPEDGKLRVLAEVPITATVFNGVYCEYSGASLLEGVGRNSVIAIDTGAYGIFLYSFAPKAISRNNINELPDELLNALRRLSGNTIPLSRAHSKLMRSLMSRQDLSFDLRCLLDTWVKTNSIPIAAIKYLHRLNFHKSGARNGN